MLAERGEKIDWCVIGEPSCAQRLGDTIRIGRRGSLSGIITVHGVEGHVAYPQLAQNPIQLFAPVITALYAESLDEGNEFFPPSSFQVVRIEAGEGAPNVIPGQAPGAVQFPLFHGLDLPAAARSRRIAAAEARPRLRVALAPVRRAIPHAAGTADRRGRRRRRKTSPACVPELSTGGGLPTAGSSRPTAITSWNSARSMPRFTRSTSTSLLRTSTTMKKVYCAILERMLPCRN